MVSYSCLIAFFTIGRPPARTDERGRDKGRALRGRQGAAGKMGPDTNENHAAGPETIYLLVRQQAKLSSKRAPDMTWTRTSPLYRRLCISILAGFFSFDLHRTVRAASGGEHPQCYATPLSVPAPRPVGNAGRRGAAMRAPPGSVIVRPGTIQRSVNAHPGKTSFLLSPGVYRDRTVVPKRGDAFYGEGHVVWDGHGRQNMALDNSDVNDVTISGIRFVHFVPPRQGAGIFALSNGGSNTLIEGCEIANNAGTPVVVGNRTKILNNSIHDNEWSGIAGSGVGDVEINHNDVFNNNLARQAQDTDVSDASGMKFLKTDKVAVINNFVHDNYGIGVWFDTDNTGSVIDGNVISRNSHRGVMVETSYGAMISNNSITDNGKDAHWISGGGIFIATSSNVEICNNILKDNRDGITGFANERGSGRLGKYTTTNLQVHDNYISTTGATGLTRGPETDPSNSFSRNHYCLLGSGGFLWGQSVDLNGWRAAGQDKEGTFDCGF
jgi:parallel beta-helix repeat protein